MQNIASYNISIYGQITQELRIIKTQETRTWETRTQETGTQEMRTQETRVINDKLILLLLM